MHHLDRYYCLEGTRYAQEYPCPPGTYANTAMTSSLTGCVDAPAGWYVAGSASTDVTGRYGEKLVEIHCVEDLAVKEQFMRSNSVVGGEIAARAGRISEVVPVDYGAYCANVSDPLAVAKRAFTAPEGRHLPRHSASRPVKAHAKPVRISGGGRGEMVPLSSGDWYVGCRSRGDPSVSSNGKTKVLQEA